ncbi:hypothetical protein [Paenibacillus humicola]|uniref:hypothetical protein n=1 Tax=Paenibacillus humicola TaxID=3110540 RepID=UPI00237A452D|nr:hypothetical protein [Paenibacillus humicola]
MIKQLSRFGVAIATIMLASLLLIQTSKSYASLESVPNHKLTEQNIKKIQENTDTIYIYDSEFKRVASIPSVSFSVIAYGKSLVNSHTKVLILNYGIFVKTPES